MYLFETVWWNVLGGLLFLGAAGMSVWGLVDAQEEIVYVEGDTYETF